MIKILDEKLLALLEVSVTNTLGQLETMSASEGFPLEGVTASVQVMHDLGMGKEIESFRRIVALQCAMKGVPVPECVTALFDRSSASSVKTPELKPVKVTTVSDSGAVNLAQATLAVPSISSAATSAGKPQLVASAKTSPNVTEKSVAQWRAIMAKIVAGEWVDAKFAQRQTGLILSNRELTPVDWQLLFQAMGEFLKKGIDLIIPSLVDGKTSRELFDMMPHDLLRDFLFRPDGLVVTATAKLSELDDIPVWLAKRIMSILAATEALEGSTGSVGDGADKLLNSMADAIDNLNGPKWLMEEVNAFFRCTGLAPKGDGQMAVAMRNALKA